MVGFFKIVVFGRQPEYRHMRMPGGSSHRTPCEPPWPLSEAYKVGRPSSVTCCPVTTAFAPLLSRAYIRKGPLPCVKAPILFFKNVCKSGLRRILDWRPVQHPAVRVGA